MNKAFFKGFVAVASLASALWLSTAQAQISTTPSAAQIEQFKKLPKAQQKAMAKQFGIDISALEGGNAPVSNRSAAPELQYLENQRSTKSPEAEAKETQQKQDNLNRLQPFGYDIFEGMQTAFMPNGNLSVPADYIIGPGDSLQISLYGKASSTEVVTVDNEGKISFAELEPMNVSGLSYQEVKARIADVVSVSMIGLKSSVSISGLRSIQVFVVGDVKKPGAYQLSSLSTITNALFMSGGPTNIGSLRNIELKRANQTVATLDLYKMFTQGDASQDSRLQNGDVIFINSIDAQVKIYGEVRRPAIYEIKKDETLPELIKLAGGLTSLAYPKNVLLTTLDQNYQRIVKRVDLTNTQTATPALLKGGDVVRVLPISQQFSQVVHVAGAVSRPSAYAYFDGMTLNDLIASSDDLSLSTDMNYALIVSENKSENEYGSIVIKHFAPKEALSGSSIQLNSKDLVLFFNRYDESDFNSVKGNESTTIGGYNYLHALRTGDIQSQQIALEKTKRFTRQQLIAPLVKLLQANAIPGQYVPVAEITGQVNFPGSYPISKNATVLELIAAAGGLQESANMQTSEISRVELDAVIGSKEHLRFSLKQALAGDAKHNLAVQPKDVVNIFQKANWHEEKRISLVGEVVYPGTYTIREGENLASVIERAGGLTKFAAPESAFFTRESLKALEKKQARELARNLSKELAFKSITSTYGNIAIGEVQSLVNNLTVVDGVGRLIIDLPRVIEDENHDIQLEDGDKLYIPTYREEVSIVGEVQVATTHIYNPMWELEDYLASSGGLRQQADDDRVYVIRANGLVEIPDATWIGRDNTTINPGDTIVVPLDASYTDRLTLWEKATSIFYQLTVGLAAIASF